LYTLSYIEFWRRLRNDKNKHSKEIANKPLDCDEKPNLPKEVLANADIDVLSHSDLLQSISHLNSTNANATVSASTTLSKPANVGDLRLEIVDTR